MTRIVKKDDSSEVRRVTWVGLGWNAALTVLKFLAGFFGGSQALVADAIHSASDFATDIAVIVGSHFWNLPPDAEHPYGHRRFETLVTLGGCMRTSWRSVFQRSVFPSKRYAAM